MLVENCDGFLVDLLVDQKEFQVDPLDLSLDFVNGFEVHLVTNCDMAKTVPLERVCDGEGLVWQESQFVNTIPQLGGQFEKRKQLAILNGLESVLPIEE
jgi:hypothetical protein